MERPIIEEIRNVPLPAGAFRALKDRPYSFFLDSSSDPEKLGRFSFLGCDPFLVFRSKRDCITLEEKGRPQTRFKSNPFTALKEVFQRYAMPDQAGPFPFTSGGVGYFAYDLKDFTERLPDTAEDDLGLDDCIMGFYDAVIIYDNLLEKAYIASSGLPETDRPKRSSRAARRIEELKAKILEDPAAKITFSQTGAALKSNFSKAGYEEAIRKAKQYIGMGDIYQVNLSQRFETEDIEMDAYELYLRLRKLSPAPFSAYLGFGEVSLLSSSPERFLLKRGDYIETRPIKGTRPRGTDKLTDALMEKELLDSPKDRAEHVMIVDLERNDLGRICEYGSVFPSEFVILEKYSTVFHLVSTVSGRLKKGVDAVDCLAATFPGGSITGAPKIRAMEIIEELEPVKRSVYTGSIGYISFDGKMDTSIVIRTFLVKGRKIYFQVGGGIVADSDPEKEYQETLDKAKALVMSLGVEADKKDAVLV